MLVMMLALACTPDTSKDSADSGDSGAEVVDSGASDSGTGDSGSGDSGSSAECNTDNEECAPGVSGCRGEGGEMLPGADCIACHSYGNAQEPDEMGLWTVAGTAFTDIDGSGPLSGAIITVTGSDGNSFTLNSNRAGNFYSERTIALPLTATIQVGDVVREMSTEVDTGACNSCHQCEGEAGGKLYGG